MTPSHQRSTGPPALPLLLLRLVCRAEEVDGLVGDLTSSMGEFRAVSRRAKGSSSSRSRMRNAQSNNGELTTTKFVPTVPWAFRLPRHSWIFIHRAKRTSLPKKSQKSHNFWINFGGHFSLPPRPTVGRFCLGIRTPPIQDRCR